MIFRKNKLNKNISILADIITKQNDQILELLDIIINQQETIIRLHEPANTTAKEEDDEL